MQWIQPLCVISKLTNFCFKNLTKNVAQNMPTF